MNKRIVAINLNTNPDNPKFGFKDSIKVHSETGCKIYPCSTCPNPPKGKYGWLAPCLTFWKCVQHPKFGKTLILHDGSALPSRVKNPNQGGEKYLTEVFIHEGNIGGQNPDWRGSAGCVTLRRDIYPKFISNFDVGEKGYFELVDSGVETLKIKEIEMEKNVLKSKTFYLNLIAILIEVVQVLTGENVIPTGVSTIAVAFLNIIMRRISKDKVKFFK